jgi:AcrR family transcriptional regulator
MPEIPAWLPDPPRPVRGEDMMRRILDAGRASFSTLSYEGARVDDIVTEAGISHGAFYLYFRNKEDLLHRLAVDCAAAIRQLTEDLAALPRPIDREQLRAWIASFVAVYQQDGPVIRVWLDNKDADPLMQALANDSLGPLARALARLVEPDTVAAVGEDLAGLAMLSMLERLSSYFATIDGSVVTATTTRLLFATTVAAAPMG